MSRQWNIAETAHLFLNDSSSETSRSTLQGREVADLDMGHEAVADSNRISEIQVLCLAISGTPKMVGLLVPKPLKSKDEAQVPDTSQMLSKLQDPQGHVHSDHARLSVVKVTVSSPPPGPNDTWTPT